MKTIPAHAGETYTHGFDFTGWIAADDYLTEVVSVEVVAIDPVDAPALSIGAFAVVGGKVAVDLGVPEDAPAGAKYTIRAIVNSVKGSGLRLDGILEVVE